MTNKPRFHVFNSNKSPERPPITEGEEVFAASPTEHRTMKVVGGGLDS